MSLVDHYAALGLKRGASLEEIKAAYRTLALQVHPDMVHDDDKREAAELRFRQISEAHAVLTDPSQRRLYDRANPYAGSRDGAGRASRTRADPRSGRREDQRKPFTPYGDEDIGDFFDADEWQRMHFGPTQEQWRASMFQQYATAKESGWRGPWEDPRLSERENYGRRRAAESRFNAWMEAERASSTESYRKYAAQHRERQAVLSRAWPKRLMLLGAVGVMGVAVLVSTVRRRGYHDDAPIHAPRRAVSRTSVDGSGGHAVASRHIHNAGKDS